MAKNKIQLPEALCTALQPSSLDSRRVVLMTCGIAGSGKSTLSKAVISQYPSFIRLSIDVYIYDKYGAYDRDYPASNLPTYQDEAEEAVKSRLRDILHTRQNDVVLDLSCAYRETRDMYRAIVEEGGARAVLVYFDCDRATLWERIQARERGGLDADSAFRMTEEILDSYLRGFEVPSDEGQIVIKVAQERE